MGWAGGILAKELAQTGLKIVILERGPQRSAPNNLAFPPNRDELRFARRHELAMDPAKETFTARNRFSEVALPMRRLGSFLPGSGVGGSGVQWNGTTWRWKDHELRIRTRYEERYGKDYIPADTPLQDWGITNAELEPYYEKFEYMAGVSGRAGNLRGQIQPGGNPFEDPRSRDYPLPPLVESYVAKLTASAAAELGYHPFPKPTANASERYTNPDGITFEQCQYCGFCDRFACAVGAKGSPQITVIPTALRNPNVELRTNSWATVVVKDSTGKKATGVRYVDVLTEKEFEQPAELVILAAYGLSNVHLMLISGIGIPYESQSQTGVVGKNYCYQGSTASDLFFEGRSFNPFINAGGWGTTIDDFHGDWNFDRSKYGFIGGSVIFSGAFSRPIGSPSLPPATPQWGSDWKRATAKWFQSSMYVVANSAVMPNRFNCLDLDPTYKNKFGMPLMRITYDFKANDHKIGRHAAKVIGQIGKTMNPTVMSTPATRMTWNVAPYQSTHNTGGAIMGADPSISAVNKYLQSWDVSNVFVVGASAFPQNSGYNPTGLVGALAYWAADGIRERYLKDPSLMI
jgi:gluconate 2-dehydrogenase alpha chain